MFSALVGHRFSNAAGRPRAWIGFDYASGDDNPNDGAVETYSKVFATGHKWFGYNDVIGRQNIIDLSFGVNISPARKLQINIDNHFFWRASNADSIYSPGGGVIRAGNTGTSTQVGSELDITLKYKINMHLSAQVGWGRFFAGDFIAESGSHKDIDLAYTQLKFTF